MNFIGLLRTLEAITRPAGHDDDRPLPDGAEQLAEREAEEEVSEPVCPVCYGAGFLPWEKNWPRCTACDPAATPTEPGLTPDELVGVRGLLQERYGDQRCTCPSWGNPSWPHRHDCPANPSARVNQSPGACAEPTAPAERYTAGSGPSEVSGHSPVPPSEGRPPHPVPREQRQGTYCEDYETDGCSVDVCPEGCYHALKFRDDAVAEWIGGAVPAICTVLHEHRPLVLAPDEIWCASSDEAGYRETHGLFDDWQGWLEHVAPLVAVHIQNALPDYSAITPQSEMIGCDACDDRPFIIKHPDGSTRFVCQYHGLIAVEETQK